MKNFKRVKMNALKGCKILGAEVTRECIGAFRVLLTLETDKGTFRFVHEQECSELVWLEDGFEDLKETIGETILKSEVVFSDEEDISGYEESWTWTFYKLSSFNRDVTLRFYGCSNGYYSEEVDLFFKEVDKN